PSADMRSCRDHGSAWGCMQGSYQAKVDLRPALADVLQVEELTIGGGNVVFGYKRVWSEDDVLDVSAQVGLQSLLSLTSTRRLDRQTGLD
ncbi:hypothetical protein HaLaN_31645, partial [Haematococcus lacustris]